MIHKRFILLLGMLISRQAAAGQISALQIAPTQKSVSPLITVFRAESKTLLAPSFLLSDRENTLVHISTRFSGLDERDQVLERLLPVIKVKTLILTQVSVPLVEVWNGKLELGAFQSTLRTQNVQLGALGYAAMRDFPLPQQNFPGGLRAIHLTGLSLNFHFGWVEGTRRPTQAWRYVPRIVAALLN